MKAVNRLILRGHSTRHSAEASWMNRLKSPIRVRKFFFPHYMPAREEKGRVPQKYLQCADAGRDDMEFEEYERTGTGRTSDLHNEGGDRGFLSVS